MYTESIILPNSIFNLHFRIYMNAIIYQGKARSEVLRDRIARDECRAWIRWMKLIPAPFVLDLSGELRDAASHLGRPTQLKARYETASIHWHFSWLW